MRLGTRLLLPLLSAVVIIMGVYAVWALEERESSQAPQARLEVQAYATALAQAYDFALRDARREDVQALLNDASRSPALYGILVYDSTGRHTIVSDPLESPGSAPEAILERVLRRGETVSFEREIEGQVVYSVLRPLHQPGGGVTGALEVVQPLSLSELERAQVRWRFSLNLVSLLLAESLLMLWLVRRIIARPMERLVRAARAIGGGDLTHRISSPAGGGEIAELAREFNGMAQNLELAHAAIARESEERVTLERRLREAEKMAAIGNLAAGLAHEIAAPLNVISGRAEMMLRKEPEPLDRGRNLQIIVRQIGRITTTVRNLLDFAKRRELRLRPVDLSELIDGVLELLEAELTATGIVVAREGTGPAWVSGDSDLLHQLLVNLVLNAQQALEAWDGPRTLTLRIGESPEPGTPRMMQLVVEDSGPGIAPGVLATLFEPFVTTKVRGTGLGLVVARRVVEEHGGRIEVWAEGAGACFRVLLPRGAPPAGSLSDV